MATPTVSATLDKSSYKVGDVATLTVNYSDPNSNTLSVTVTVSDSSGATSAPVTVSATISPAVITISDSSGHVWTKQSDSGSVAVYTTTV